MTSNNSKNDSSPINDLTSLIYLLENDAKQTEKLNNTLQDKGYTVQIFTDKDTLFSTACNSTDFERPLAIVIEATYSDNKLVSPITSDIERCNQHDIHVIVTSTRDDLSARLAAFRAGIKHCISKSNESNCLLNFLSGLVESRNSPSYRILLVDDDKEILKVYETILNESGMKVETLSEPLKTLDTINIFAPDVLILDTDMPEVSGPELAAVLRDSGFQLPIIFLTNETEMTLQLQALNLGGDDFLVKPVQPEYLIAAVTARAQRSRKNSTTCQNLATTIYERDREHLALNQHAIVSIADREGNITYVNDLFCDISGFSSKELLGQNHRIGKSGKHSTEFYKEMWHTITNGNVWKGELCNQRKDGSLYWVESTITPFLDEDGKPYQYVSIRTDITQVKESEQTLRAIVDSTSSLTGEALFQSSVKFLAESLGIRFSFIAEKDANDASAIKTIAIWDTDHIIDNFSYAIKDTPCEQVLSTGLSVYAGNVAETFPKDLWLKENGIESYIGIPLYDSNKNFLGHMGVMDNKPITNIEKNVTLLRLFAASIASEIEREQAIEALNIHKERLRRGQIFANIGTWDWNIQSGELFWSERIGPLFGYAEGVLDTSYDNFINAVHPDDRQAVIDAVNTCVENDAPYDIEHRVVWPDGTVRWLLERGAVLRDDDGKPLQMLGVVEDIDERKLAQKALQESQEKLSGLFELSPLGIALTDMNGKYVEFNKAFQEICGYPAEELNSLDYWTLTPREYEAQEAAQLESLNTTGRYGPYEKVYRQKNGHLIPIRLNGILVKDHMSQPKIWSIVEDITDQKQSEKAIRESQQRMALHVQRTPLGVIEWDNNFCVTEWNSAAEFIFGFSKEEVLGKHATEFVIPSHVFDDVGEIWEQLLTLKGGLRSTNENITRDGNTVLCDWYNTPLIDEDGKVIGVASLVQDITKQKDDEMALIKAKQEAEYANKAKSEFLSSMSHELRTPMNAILGFSQLLQLEESFSDEQKDNVNEIINAGKHLLTLINEVLDLAKVESGQIDMSLESIEVNSIIKDCFTLIKTLADKRNIKITHSCLQNIAVRADYTRLKQALLNLLSNAIKYNRENGSIMVEVLLKDDKHIAILVKDTGSGIPETRLPELFQPFNRLEAETSDIEGTGIGLTITQRIIEMMGGRVGVESEVGIGSTFWIELPRVTSIESESDILTANDGLHFHKTDVQHTLLYIEDNPANLKLVEQILGQRSNIHLLTAHTHELGIELTKAREPELILLDINMPGKNGYQVMEIIKADKHLQAIPVIAVSANAMLSDIKRGKDAGFTDYITKPLNVNRLLDIVDKCLYGQSTN